ncbi:MAG: hypothetical protein ACJASQ_004149 [Crocinitomicaceae bacterium]|jgi:hypothetical protein
MMTRTLFFLLIALTSCSGNENSQKKSANPKFDEAITTIDIINQTLPVLMPDSIELMLLPFYSENPDKETREQEYKLAQQSHKEFIDSVGMALNLNKTLFIPDTFEINWMLKKGANNILKRFLSDSLTEKLIDLSKIDSYGRVKLTLNYPNSSSEMDRHYAFIGYSRVIFHSNNKKAIFIYRTSKIRSCMSSETNAVEVQQVDGKWKVIFNSREKKAY